MKIYIAGRYGRRKELLGYAEELRGQGHNITSRWLAGAHEDQDAKPMVEAAKRWAVEDIEDIDAADALIAFTEAPGDTPGRSRGGRHVEFGYAIGKGKPVCIVGIRENVFCHLPQVMHFDTFNQFITWGWLWLRLHTSRKSNDAI